MSAKDVANHSKCSDLTCRYPEHSVLEKEVKSIDPKWLSGVGLKPGNVIRQCFWCADDIKGNPFYLQRDREPDYKAHCAECTVQLLLSAIKHGWKVTQPAMYKIKVEKG